MNKGILYAIGAYLLWGVFPVYWKLIQTVPAVEIIAHRILWSFIFVNLVILLSRQWRQLWQLARQPRRLLPYVLMAALLGVNWLTYVWGVNAGYIVETSLGYFINPLVSVLMGVVFLRERLRSWQWVSVALATIGILYLTWQYGALPWIALVLAFSFGTYGLIKKQGSLGATQSFAAETGFMLLPALVYLVFLEINGRAAFAHSDPRTTFLLIFSGVATGLPLLLFGAGARLIPLSSLGFLQYIAPTMQLMIGLLVYGEPFPQERLVGFGLIWVALGIFTVEGFQARRKRRADLRANLPA
ncbi:MAG: EamA family transporter RarD [Anaerolineales bacterium]|nr:EamA family transporter RarD [Anaerolineales bacterium]